MTNFKKYKNEVLRILEVSECEIPGVKNGIPIVCESMGCKECDLHGDDVNCIHEFIKWLYEDDGEDPDGCDGCKYEHKREDESPCTECSSNYMSKWERRPKKTRQDEFLEMFPNALMIKSVVEPVIDICPKYIDGNKNKCRDYVGCIECHKDYWFQEVE